MARWLGIDIAPQAVRIALLRSTLRRPVIETLREEPLSVHPTVEAAIRAAVAGLRIDACAVAVPGEQTFLRRIELPAAAQKELASVLGYEVESTLPFELDDAVMDHRVLKAAPGVDRRQSLPILAGVAYTHQVRDRINLIRRTAGQEPARVGAGALPLANLAQLGAPLRGPELRLLLDVDATHCDLVLMRGGEPQQARTIHRGAARLPAEGPALVRELRQTLAAWQAQGGQSVERLVLLGQGPQTPGLDAYLREELGVQVDGLPPLEADWSAESDRPRAGIFAKAIGLALGLSRRAAALNLRTGPLEPQQSFRFLRDKTPLLAGLGTAIAFSFGFSVFADMRALDTERAALEEQLATATEAVFGEPTRDPAVAAQQLDRALSGKTDDPMGPIDAFDVMVELSERIAPEITHDIAELDYNRGQVLIRGIVPKIDDADVIRDKLAEHPCFHDVKKKGTTRLRNADKHKYVLEFEVKCTAKDPQKARAKTSAPPAKDSGETGGTR